MSCFDNLIGLTGTCNDTASDSGFTLGDIGISNDFLANIVTNEFSDGEALAANKINLATKLVVATISNFFSDRYKTNSVIDGTRIGQPSDNLQIISGSNLRGIEIELCNDTSFLDLCISQIQLQLDHTGDVDVLFYDLAQDRLLATETVTVAPNEISTLDVALNFVSDRRDLDLIAVYDATGIDSIKTTIDTTGCSTCSGGRSLSRLNGFLSARGIEIPAASQKIQKNLTGKGDTGGLSLQYSINCNHESWLCTIKKNLAMPILYKTGVELMEYADTVSINSRSNTTVTMNKEAIEERREIYDGKYRETLENVLKRIKLPQDRKCFECNLKSKNAVILP
jgi:hypothetical protein